MKSDVSTRGKDSDRMVTRSAPVRTLMGGTHAMRKAGEMYLPREPAESAEAYQNRLQRTTLFNATAKTVADMTGKVFAKPIILGDDVPPAIADFAEDIDLTGRHINVFACDAFYDSMQTGIGYILTDMPPALPAGSTLADEQAAGIRPYLVYVPMENLLGWKSTTVNGAETLLQIRILEIVSEPDGEFLEKEIEQIRVIEPNRWRTYRKPESGDNAGQWTQYEEGTRSLAKITLAPIYINRTGFMTGAPPLEKLADLNIAHWQSQSDQRNILHVARVPILFWAGKNDDERVVVGANAMMFSRDPNAKLTYVEHTGAAIGAGDKDLENLEAQMQAMGLQLLVSTPGKTATGETRDDSKENAPLAMMARALGDALEISLGFMAEYMGIVTNGEADDSGGSVVVNTDFGIQASNGADLQWLTAAVAAGDISKETYWAELQRRGTLSDSFDSDVEKERIANDAANSLDAGPGRGMPLDTSPAELGTTTHRTGIGPEHADRLFQVS